MIPVLASAYPYTGNGLGGLSDAISCKVTHEVNGVYDLQMTYPVTGLHFSELLTNYVVMAKPDALTAAQPFRIYRITKPLNGIVTVYAHHICYDMSGTVVEPFTSGSLTAVMTDLPNKCTPASSFTISTTRSVATSYTLKEPRALWRVLGGQEGSLLDIYGGEWDFNLLTANLVTTLGTDRGVNIRYGKNLTKLEQDLSLESTYAGVFPYWYDEDSNTLVALTEKYVTIAGASSSRILCLDCSDEFEAQPTEQELRDYTNAYITKNSCGDPKVSWKIDFVMLSQAGEYATQAALEQVGLGDTVHVYYEALGVNASARAVKMEWDVLKDNYISVTIGRVKQNLASIIVGQNRETEDKIKSAKSFLEQAIDDSTNFIKNGSGYMRLIYDSSDNLVEIVSLDNPDIAQATNVWRWNNGGFGFSSTGYSGTYGLALTQNGAIVADYITTGTLNANVIRAGILQDAANKNSWNLTTGAFTITDGSIHITTSSSTVDSIVLTYGTNTTAMNASNFYVQQDDQHVFMGPGGIAGYSSYSNLTSAFGIGMAYSNGSLYGVVTLENAAGTQTVQISGGETNPLILLKDSSATSRVTIYGETGRIITTNSSGNEVFGFYTPGNKIYISNNSQHYAVTLGMVSGSDASGSLNVYDGTSNYIRASVTTSGLSFANSSGTTTATYPATGLGVADLNNSQAETISTSGTTKNYTLASGIYLVVTARLNSTYATNDALYIVNAHTNSHITTVYSGTGTTSVSISGQTLTVTTGANNIHVSIIRI